MTNKIYPSLAICIPTYNRLHALEKCIEALIESIQKYKNHIKIYIMYNESSDGTENFLAKLFENYKNLIVLNKSTLDQIINNETYMESVL